MIGEEIINNFAWLNLYKKKYYLIESQQWSLKFLF